MHIRVRSSMWYMYPLNKVKYVVIHCGRKNLITEAPFGPTRSYAQLRRWNAQFNLVEVLPEKNVASGYWIHAQPPSPCRPNAGLFIQAYGAFKCGWELWARSRCKWSASEAHHGRKQTEKETPNLVRAEPREGRRGGGGRSDRICWQWRWWRRRRWWCSARRQKATY